MSDVRLIDANALRNVFDAMHAIEGGSRFDHLVLLGIKKYIDDAPTIDAVPVVRCRECMFSEALPISRYCLQWNSLVKKNGFCYKAKKMDGGAE